MHLCVCVYVSSSRVEPVVWLKQHSIRPSPQCDCVFYHKSPHDKNWEVFILPFAWEICTFIFCLEKICFSIISHSWQPSAWCVCVQRTTFLNPLILEFLKYLHPHLDNLTASGSSHLCSTGSGDPAQRQQQQQPIVCELWMSRSLCICTTWGQIMDCLTLRN